jgi:hypothetical protein
LNRRWRVLDKGVNGRPFLWKKQASTKYVMIDIFTPRPKRCYAVLTLETNPKASNDLKGKVIGRGCAKGPTDWNGAYERARKIAYRYMIRNSV